MKKLTTTLFLTFCFIQLTHSQTFDLSADLRPRFEYRHGYGSLFPDDADPAAFVTQRSRLNFNYTDEKLKLMLSVQDVSTWGDTRQTSPVDGNDSFSLFQAWAELSITENWAIKAGRQSIAYDNERIFGALDWAMQGRFHDAALIKYRNDGFMADAGFAFSQTEISNEGTAYDVPGFFTYKTMQYLYAQKSWEKASASLLFLNTGFQNFDEDDEADGVYYTQTLGSYFKFPVSVIGISGSFYYQFGKAYPVNVDLSAYEFMLEASYKPVNTLFALGFEAMSGSDQGGSDNNSFFPLYGTNHAYNGFMDYFYVGNYANSAGLNDLYGKVVWKTGEKSDLLVSAHYFGANGDLANDADAYLGTEIDLQFTQKLMKFATLKVGYSHMFASESMSLIKDGRPNDNSNNWAWAMLVINPTLFTHTIK
ncbi:alginate export family protein [Galbibacter sp. PAP.153]|uniref:alginate export family protein n=1 Tax=Galbibacter sp. PAP.153 TaxID=3104623 RepID=UPI00300BEC28